MPKAYPRNADLSRVSVEDLRQGLIGWLAEHAARRFPSEQRAAWDQVLMVWHELGKRMTLDQREELYEACREEAKALLEKLRPSNPPREE